ncbi:hypothetical protein PTKIN_Ptkin16aG0500900 [Pterospermum kingtungense]
MQLWMWKRVITLAGQRCGRVSCLLKLRPSAGNYSKGKIAVEENLRRRNIIQSQEVYCSFCGGWKERPSTIYFLHTLSHGIFGVIGVNYGVYIGTNWYVAMSTEIVIPKKIKSPGHISGWMKPGEESDFRNAVNWVLKPESAPWRLRNIINHVENLKAQVKDWRVVHVL